MSASAEAWLEEVRRLTATIAQANPRLAEQADHIAHLATLTAIALPQAEAYTDPGDGIRSPSLDGGSRSVGTHSAPTEATAVAHADLTDTRQTTTRPPALVASARARRSCLTALRIGDLTTARLWAVDAYGQLLTILRPVDVTALKARGGGDKGCIGHRKAGAHQPSDPRHRGLCRWCWDFDRAWGQLPPAALVHHHDAGYRITTTMAEEAMRRRKPKAVAKPKRTQPTRRDRMLTRIREAALRLTHP